jgi:putative membrane protein
MPDTLVLAVDRAGDVPRQTSVSTPIVGREAVRSLVFEMGVSDPEDAIVNTLLEALRVTRDLQDDGVDAAVAVVSGDGTGVVGADRAVAAGLDDLLESRNPDSAVLVLDSAEDEQLVPVVESRIPVDAVDRVVVRQARDLESTYYLLKQFLADEELRETVLVPVGIVLLVFPALMLFTGSLAVAAASITAVVGLFLLYKGLGVDDWVDTLPAEARDALYSGQVSVVTYVVAGGLALVGVFAGALGVSVTDPPLLVVMAFVHDSVPWLALSALAASAGRLVDEAIRAGEVRSPYLNLPFVVVAVGLVLRGFAAYFLQRADLLAPAQVPRIHVGALTLSPVALTPEQRLAGFVAAGVVVSLVGVRVASTFSGAALDTDEDGDIEESPRQQQ